MRSAAICAALLGARCLSVVATDSAAAGCAQHEAAGVCRKRMLSDTVWREDTDAVSGLGLVQTALLAKTHQLRLAELRANTSKLALAGGAAPKRKQCLHDEHEASYLPLSLTARTEITVFRELGVLGSARAPCSRGGEIASLMSMEIMPNSSVEEKNKVAHILVMTWILAFGGVILWSILSVLAVARKREWENSMVQRKLNLANEDEAFKKGILHWMSLSWVDSLIGRYGKCLHAVVSDTEIVDPPKEGEFAPYNILKRHWSDEVKAKGIQDASMVKALYRLIGFKAVATLVGVVFTEMLFSMVGMVLALDKFMTYLEVLSDTMAEHPERPVSLLEPSMVVIGLLFGVPMVYRSCAVISSLLDGHYCNKCAAGLGSLVYEKALSLPVGCAAEEEASLDKPPDQTDPEAANKKPSAVQLLNVDIVETWGGLLRQLLVTIFSPLIALILFAMLIKQLKLAGLIGCCYIIPCMVATVASQLLMIKWWKRYQAFQDTRLKNLTETVLHIRTIKSLAWENLSFKRLNDARTSELACNQKTITLGGLVMSILHTSPWLSLLIALYANLVIHGGIQAHEILVVQRLMMSLLDSLGAMQMGLRKFSQVPNSFRRIRAYLAQPDRPKGVVREPTLSMPNSPAVRLQGSFTFVEGKPCTLKGLDVAIPRGELVAIVGEVASGKSALLQAVIGEMYGVDGAYVEAPPSGSARLAYCSQVPWIFEGTLRDNIVLKQAFDDDRYHKALFSAALMPDLQILPGGDQVTIGSYGVRLSGGQRARVALARAAYMKESEVVVIDDPFASVDVPTGQHLLEELLCGPLMQGRTRIVVTQPNAARLSKFDRVLLLKGGAVVASGPPAEVLESKEFQALQASEDMPATTDAPGRTSRRMKATALRSQNSGPATSLREVEAQEHVTWGAIKWWVQAAGYGNIAFFGTMVVAQRMLMLRENLALAMWIDAKMLHPINDMSYIYLTLVYVVVTCVCIWLVAYAASRVSISAATKMHSTVVYTILRAPIDKFFDKQPVGRLITRLSFDMRQVDDYIPIACVTLLMFFFGFIVTQTYILRVLPFKIALAALPFYMCVFCFAYLYRGTAVPLVFHSKFSMSQLQDLQAVVLTTCVSIRANGMFDDFMQKYNCQAASITRCQYLIHYACKAWVQARIFLCLGTLTCLFAIGGLYNNMAMGTLGTVVSLSFQQMVEFENISTVFTQFLNILNALQRLTNYFKVVQEAPASLPSDPAVRLRARVQRPDVPRLQIRRGQEAEACLPPAAPGKGSKTSLVVCLRGAPVLCATPDGLALAPVEGVSLAEIFPTCAELREAEGNATPRTKASFLIVAVNSLSKDAEKMAEELCNPPSNLWLDLWNSSYAAGMRIQMEDLTAGYGNDKNVLEKVQIDIPARSKVGFAGKTGCGKSTTLLCILRILEPRGGRIVIGGLDTSKLGLAALRTIVGLVPQDPTVFVGTWRHNIDPFGEFPDGRIWEALQSVQLLPYIRSLAGGIDSEIAAEGANISFGQRQLLSLARMVIRQPPVLLLDECTSALDPNTQQAAQDTLLREFPMSTMIAIAHRVETILDFDRIVTFDKGSVAEQGTVKEVLSIEDGIFRRMVDATKGLAAGGAASDGSP